MCLGPLGLSRGAAAALLVEYHCPTRLCIPPVADRLFKIFKIIIERYEPRAPFF